MITRRFASLCIYIFLIFFPFLVQGQQSAHTSGGDGISNTGSVSVSIGQVAYISHSLGMGTKTQGVQQRYDLVQVKSCSEPSLVQTSWSKKPVLPSKVAIVLSEGQSFEVGVTWDFSTINLFARGTYTLFGDLSLPNYIGNTNKMRAQMKVQVLPKASPIGLILSNNSFEASKTNFIIAVGEFVIADSMDNVHYVGLYGEEIDNNYFEIKNNILYWNSAEPASGKTIFRISVRITDRDGNTIDKFFEISRTRAELSSLTIPNSFTPGAVDGFNDTWGMPELRFYEGTLISVYDRWGDLLFYTENPDLRWDGNHKGKEMPVGVYFWIIQVRETGEKRRGVLNLIRK